MQGRVVVFATLITLITGVLQWNAGREGRGKCLCGLGARGRGELVVPRTHVHEAHKRVSSTLRGRHRPAHRSLGGPYLMALARSHA